MRYINKLSINTMMSTNNKTYERTTKLGKTDKNSIEKAISEESLSVKLKNNPNKDNRQ